DVVWTQNAVMNIADRARLYAGMRRVLRRGGRLAVQDVVAGPGGAPHFPAPWARGPEISFLLTAEATRAALEAAGFRVVAWEDTTREALDQALARAQAAAAPAPLGLHLLLGDAFPAMMKTSLRNLQEGRVGLINAVLAPA